MSQFKRYIEMINEGRVGPKLPGGQQPGYLDKKEKERKVGGFYVDKPDMIKEPGPTRNGPKTRRKYKRSESGTTGGIENRYRSGVQIIPGSQQPTPHEKNLERIKKEKEKLTYYNSLPSQGFLKPGRLKKQWENFFKTEECKKALSKHKDDKGKGYDKYPVFAIPVAIIQQITEFEGYLKQTIGDHHYNIVWNDQLQS